jgi:hypothetical protein
MHGGLFSDDNVVLEDLRKIDRNRQPPEEGLMCELLWSDPQHQNGRSPSKRGVGCQFGPGKEEKKNQKTKLYSVTKMAIDFLSNRCYRELFEAQQFGLCCTFA